MYILVAATLLPSGLNLYMVGTLSMSTTDSMGCPIKTKSHFLSLRCCSQRRFSATAVVTPSTAAADFRKRAARSTLSWLQETEWPPASVTILNERLFGSMIACCVMPGCFMSPSRNSTFARYCPENSPEYFMPNLRSATRSRSCSDGFGGFLFQASMTVARRFKLANRSEYSTGLVAMHISLLKGPEFVHPNLAKPSLNRSTVRQLPVRLVLHSLWVRKEGVVEG